MNPHQHLRRGRKEAIPLGWQANLDDLKRCRAHKLADSCVEITPPPAHMGAAQANNCRVQAPKMGGSLVGADLAVILVDVPFCWEEKLTWNVTLIIVFRSR